MAEISDAARALHDDALIVDGLIAFSDGETAPLRAGNVAAANLTVATFQAGFTQACDEMAAWLDRLSRPGCAWRLVLQAADIAAARAEGKIGLVMGWQNLRPIGDRLDRFAFFHRLGVRVMQLTYNERNFVGDGCLEPDDGGLSAFGKHAIHEMERLRIAIDLSHVGERTCRDAIDVATRPVLLTHANARAVCPSARNKSDAVIEAVVATGGLVGAGMHGALCWSGEAARPPMLADALRNIEHVAALVGPENMSLGTDFVSVGPEGQARLDSVLATTLKLYPAFMAEFAAAFGNDARARYPADCNSVAELAVLTDALLQFGWSDTEIRGLLGLNLVRVLGEIWGG